MTALKSMLNPEVMLNDCRKRSFIKVCNIYEDDVAEPVGLILIN